MIQFTHCRLLWLPTHQFCTLPATGILPHAKQIWRKPKKHYKCKCRELTIKFRTKTKWRGRDTMPTNSPLNMPRWEISINVHGAFPCSLSLSEVILLSVSIISAKHPCLVDLPSRGTFRALLVTPRCIRRQICSVIFLQR